MIRLYVCAAFLLLVVPVNSLAETTDTVPAPGRALEIRAGLIGNGGTASVEFRYLLSRLFSVDAVALTAFPAVQLGVSIYPVDLLYLQGTAGWAGVSEDALHHPGFSSEYSYTIRAGVRVRLGERWTVSLGAGALSAVDVDYCLNCGGDFNRPGPAPKYQSETGVFQFWETGVGLRW